MLLHAKIPHAKFNAAVKDGTVGEKIRRILEVTKPEAVYFTNFDGKRGAISVIDVKDSSQVPAFAEPWFLLFDADVQFHVAMTPEELGRAGLDSFGKDWS